MSLRAYIIVASVALIFLVRLWLHPPPVPVLLLHDVKPERSGADFWTLHPDRFRAALDLIDRLGYRGLTLAEAQDHLAGRLDRSRASEGVLITIDDGCPSAASLVGPELARRGHRGTFFVVAGWAPPRAVGVGDIQGLVKAGHDVQSHSMTHASLDQVPALGIDRELAGSRKALADVTGRPVYAMAYPKGDFNAVTKRLTRQAGYTMAFTTDTGYLAPGADDMELPRFQLNWDTPLDWIEAYLTAPRVERNRNLMLMGAMVALAALGAIVRGLNQRAFAPSCHTETKEIQ